MQFAGPGHMKTAGLIILIAGLLMTIYTGFTYISKEKTVGIGDLEMTTDIHQTINWQPYVGIGVMVVGGACLMLGRNKKLTR
jgi:hypothetical protein